MLKVFNNTKKALAVFALLMIAVCMVTVGVQAYSPTLYGSRQYNEKGYRSHTKITCYDERGIGIMMTAYAQIDNKSATTWDYGKTIANSGYVSTAYPAYHGYGYGENKYDPNTKWKEN